MVSTKWGVQFLSHLFSFSGVCPLFFLPPLLSPSPHSLAAPKAPGDGRRARTIRPPRTRSTTPTRAPLNTNAPNPPQPPTARAVSRDLGRSRWWRCTRKATPPTRRTSAARRNTSTAGPTTALRLRGEEAFFFRIGEFRGEIVTLNCSSPSASLSQDLAKDLAILAREIHGVAGDGDPQDQEGSGTPISRVTTHEHVCSAIVKVHYFSSQEEEVPLWLAQILFRNDPSRVI